MVSATVELHLVLLWAVSVTVVSVCFLILYRERAAAKPAAALPGGTRVPNMRLQTMTGSPTDLHSLLQGVTLLVVTSKGCPMCEKVAPGLAWFSNRVPGVAVRLVITNSVRDAAQWRDEMDITLPAYAADLTYVARKMKVPLVPFALLMDGQGFILHQGPFDLKSESAWIADIARYQRLVESPGHVS